MTHQNHQTNGASLEDCHTNFFALTELYGIKWRKLVWGETSGGGEGDEGAAPLADPVISSYARCLAGDILCVWRRVPAQPPPSVDIYEMRAPARPPPLSLRAAKELWIFWYGEEPDLNGLVAPELISSQGEQGSWESGLSYECRSLLFKALHNLIERCLLSRDFVRLGKWFVQPYDGDEEDVGKSPWHLSFSFAFFLHGESTVCASVDVRQHPPVRTLTAKRMQRLHAAERQPDAKVILAPFGLEGTLTGREWTDSDPATARLFDAWRQHYPLEQGCAAVEVCCGGARMRYPLPYVLVTEMESPPASPPAHSLAHRALTALTTPTPHQTPEVCYGDASGDKSEDLVDPTRKTPCTCAKWRRRRLRPPPFHRRTRPHQVQPHRPKAHAHAQAVAGGAVGGCSPGSGSCGGGSPGAGGSAPPSAGPPPHSPHHAHHAHAQHHHSANNSHQSASAVPTTLHTPAPTPDPHAPPTPAPPSLPPPKAYNQGDSPPSGVGANALCASDGGEQPLMELGKPPTLPSAERRLDPLEDEHSLHMLYDYSTVYAWLEHPVKRFKTEEVCFREELALGSSEGDLYAGHEHTSMPATPHHDRRDYKQERHDHDDTKEYKNLFTSDGLCATFKDLDQIFDNSDDAASGDETVRLLQVSTPPDSNKSGEERERGCAGRMVRAEELSKMFPTPPSMEAHAQPSPGFSLPDDATPLQRHLHLAAGSPSPDTAIEDWSFVFKPPTVFKYVGSSKYAPLATLPSHLLPPVLLPPHAVYRPRRRRDDDLEPDNCRTGVKRSASPASDCRESRSRRSCEVGTGTGPPSRGEAHAHAHSDEPGSVGRHHARSPSAGREARGGAGAGAAAAAGAGAGAQADPLLLNVLLGDTVLNVFRDHNFDSCTLCVCNVSPQVVVGNIRGADASTYLCGWGGGEGAESPLPEEEACRCTCGFSAIVNRRLAYRAGLFLEDEIEITGLSEEPRQGGGGGGGGRGLGEVAGVVVAQCAALSGGRASALARAAAAAARSATDDEHRLNLLEYTDGNTAATRALRAAVGASAAPSGATGAASAVHRWPFISARAPRSSRDVVRLMRRLRPLLQDAIQKRCCGARMWDGVTGPLTWRQFHRLAGRGNEDLCEPQPVPPLLVGHDRDWISLSPYALRHWERLSLEPYSYARDVAYVVLAADGEALTDPLRTFFRELSTAYESCRLGRHQPINRVARDGIVRTSPADRDANCEEWTGTLPPGRLGEYIKAYAETLRTSLVPQLAALTVDRSLVEEERSTLNERPAPSPSPMRPPSTPDHPATPTGHSDHEGDNSANNSGCGTSSSSGLGSGAMGSWEEEEGGPPALVVYIVEPPAAHAHRSHALHALLRLAARTYNHLHHHNPLIKIISLESVCSTWGCGAGGAGGTGGTGGAGGGWCGEGSEARALAFSVFSGARRLLQHHANGKSLTGFGTAADANLFLQAKDEKNRAPYKLFSPLWVLAAPRARAEAESWAQAGGGAGTGGEGAVLFLAYCLSHDQRWLLAAATDARGELLDTAAINIHMPHRSRRRGGGPARRHGLTKLMDFALGLMSNTAAPWRLVVGRVGRIGHGELKGWNWLLSRKHLERASATLKQICGGCAALHPAGAPCILSACLVSTEPDARLRLMADRFTPDERFSQASIQSHLHTPRDVTATHILVFPTSATTQSNQTTFEPSMANGEDDIFLSVDMGEEEMGEENITDLLVGDMFNIWPTSSPRRHDDDPASPQAQHHHNANYHHQDDHNQEQVGLLLQQPLALGYLVSTAPLDAMPAWWWAQCEHLQGLCPAFLKSALHLHTAAAPDEDAFSHPAAQPPASAPHRAAPHRTHPLDSQITTDVLRYVLEGYNALSWLTLDGDTHDRLSCLPLHVQVLMQLYHTAAALG